MAENIESRNKISNHQVMQFWSSSHYASTERLGFWSYQTDRDYKLKWIEHILIHHRNQLLSDGCKGLHRYQWVGEECRRSLHDLPQWYSTASILRFDNTRGRMAGKTWFRVYMCHRLEKAEQGQVNKYFIFNFQIVFLTMNQITTHYTERTKFYTIIF